MKNKALLCALMLTAAAMTTTACNESASSTDIQQEEIQYFLACQSPVSCSLSIEEGQIGTVSMLVSAYDKSTFHSSFVQNASVQGVKVGTAFNLMDGASDTAVMATDVNGIATFSVSAVSAGTGTIQFSTSEPHVTTPVTVTINVTEKPKIDVPTAKDYAYNVGLTYNGIQKLNVANVMVYSGVSCSSLVSSGMTTSELNQFSGYLKESTEVYADGASLSSKSFKFEFNETDAVNYAVVARAMAGGKYSAYGCTDNMNRDNASIVVALTDAQLEEEPPVIVDCEKTPDDPSCEKPPVIVDCEKTPDDPSCEQPPEPEIPIVRYSGTYTLMSQFDALSLLPTGSTDGKPPLFKDMLAGDWVKFVLQFLSDPEATLPDVLTQQLLPLILDADWFRGLLEKIPTYGPLITSLLDTLQIDDLLEQFGVKQLIADYLNQLTSQIPWWDAATGGITIANEIATNFTLYGNFKVAMADLDENGQLAGNGHNYTSLLYHNGTFKSCLIGNEFGRDAKNNLVCEIPISSLDAETSSVRGAYTAKFSEIKDGVGTVDIMNHSLNLAYGKLIYAAILQILPTVVKVEPGVKLDTLSDILAYYVGLGLLNLYNSKNENNQISANVYGCDAVGEVLVKLLEGVLAGSDGEGSAWGKLISTFVQSSTLSSLCKTGLGALDTLIDTQLDKLSVTSDKVTFTSNGCNVGYTLDTNKYPTRLAYFGMDNYVWGASDKIDKRCTWDVSIKPDADSEPMTIKGKYFAVASKASK